MQRLHQLTLIFVIATFLCGVNFLSQIAHAETNEPTFFFDLGSQDGWVPYRIGEKEGEQGILADLVQLLATYSSIKFESLHLPMRRAERALIEGEVDFDFVCREWLPNGDIGDDFITSEPLFEVNEYVITLKGNHELYPNLEAIYGERIGTIGGYFYFDDDQFTRVDFIDENKLIRGLKHGRFKAIILEGQTAKHWAKINGVEIAFATLHSKGNLLIRLNKRNSTHLDELNAIITRVKDSGELRTIFENHGVEINL